MKTRQFIIILLSVVALVCTVNVLDFARPATPNHGDRSVQSAQNGTVIQEGVGDGAFDPSHQQPLVSQGNDGSVFSILGDSNNFRLSIARPGGQPVTIPLPDDIAQVNSITPAHGNKTVLIGMVNGSVAEVVIVDNLGYRIVDQFLAYEPTVSPDGRFIAFIKFYPPHFVEGTSNYEMLYDLTRSAASNRLFETDIDDDTNVGVVVYPPGIQTRSRNTDLPDADINHTTSMFFWAPDSSKYVFSDERLVKEENENEATNRNEQLAKIEMNLVLVDVTSPEKPTVSVFPTAICAARGGSCEQRLISVKFKQSGVTAQFQGFNPKGGRQQMLQVKYNKFYSP